MFFQHCIMHCCWCWNWKHSWSCHSLVHSLVSSHDDVLQPTQKKLYSERSGERLRQRVTGTRKMIILQVMKISWTFSAFLLCCLWALSSSTFHVVLWSMEKTFRDFYSSYEWNSWKLWRDISASVNELRSGECEGNNFRHHLDTHVLYFLIWIRYKSSDTFQRCCPVWKSSKKVWSAFIFNARCSLDAAKNNDFSSRKTISWKVSGTSQRKEFQVWMGRAALWKRRQKLFALPKFFWRVQKICNSYSFSVDGVLFLPFVVVVVACNYFKHSTSAWAGVEWKERLFSPKLSFVFIATLLQEQQQQQHNMKSSQNHHRLLTR